MSLPAALIGAGLAIAADPGDASFSALGWWLAGIMLATALGARR